nr:hypothetical protein [Tanacetum cinerariifolium]
MVCVIKHIPLILATYGDTVTLKRCQDDEDKDKEPSAGSNWGSKRRRARKEPESTSEPKEKTSKTSGMSTEGSKSHHKTASESAPAEEPISMDLRSIGNLLEMSTLNVESSLSQSFKSSNGITTSTGLDHCVKSYQKKLNLTKPDTYRSDLKRKKAYTAYSNPRGFIYQNKDKQNRLMCIDELHKFSDGTLNDIRTTLDDRLKRIRMQKTHTKVGNHVKEILLKLNLPDHRILKDGAEAMQTPGSGISILLAVGTPSTGSGNSLLAVGMPCAFYSQQSSPKLDAPSALKFSRIK